MNDVRASLPFDYPGRPAVSCTAKKTESFYIKSYDGTKIALDVTLPQVADSAQVPAIIMVTRDHRRNMADFETRQGYDFVKAGYAYIIVELRGCGVSYGVNDSFCDERHCRDLLATVDWVVSQNWCDGKVGIYGSSNRAFIQLCAGALAPQNITAINPVVAVADFYYQNFPNGVSACPDIHFPKPEQIPSKEEFLKIATPVDADENGEQAYEAFVEDQWCNNRNFFEVLVFPGMNRDTKHPLYNNEKTNLTIPPHGKLKPFYETGVKQHQFIGELESGTLGQLALFLDFGGTICLGPWTHVGAIQGESPFINGSFSVTDAYLKWYDYALKGRDNSWAEAPPVSYYMIGAPEGKEWRFSESWPPENEMRTTLYLSSEKSGTSHSCNDGVLSRVKEEDGSSVSYQVRDDIVVFPDEENRSGYNRSKLFWDGDMEPSVDSKGLTFTSAPLFPMYQNEFAGCISVNLWISCDQKDVDLIVYAEEVFTDGRSYYIKDGVMRASHRTTGSNSAWERMGAHWHTSMEEDVNRCLARGLDEPTLVQFAIDPTCYHFQPNSRLRITITCANKTTFQHTMYGTMLPTLTVYTGGKYASSISVPFLECTYRSFSGVVEIDGAAYDAALYRFAKHVYLHANGRWHKFHSTHENQVDGDSLLLAPGIRFQQLGGPEAFPAAYLTQYSQADKHPAARFPGRLVSTEPVNYRNYTLFVPAAKSLYLDLFKQDDQPAAPCIVFVHGYGAASNCLPAQMRLMYHSGYAIASVDLRNYPPNLFPDYIQDVKGGIRYLRAHADEFGIDPNRIGIYGFSLGGNTSLMIALTGDDAGLEGTIGGNLQYSSRVQAAACGFAWSDLLHMGSDIAQENASTADKTIRRVELTEGEFSPSSEVIGFAGSGCGLRVLREYAQNSGRKSDPYLDEKLRQAAQASPVNHITPAAPPIALFGGFGDDGVNIAFRQCLRTFTALEQVGGSTFLFGNTCGKYGETEESLSGIKAFFDRHLAEKRIGKKLVITAGIEYLVENDVSRRLLVPAQETETGFWIYRSDLMPYLHSLAGLEYEEDENLINVLTLKADGMTLKRYPQHHAVTLCF